MTDAPPETPLAAEFLVSADRLERCPIDDEPEIAFVGRSNAGKSSALNRLAGARALARVGKTPGRTQLLNFFAVRGGGRLVDLPGLGYARVPQYRREAWGRTVDEYLNKRANLTLVVHVMDARRPLQRFDQTLIERCRERDAPLLALLTKADKLNRAARAQALRETRERLPGNAAVLLFSAQTGLGAGEALRMLRETLASAGRALRQSAARR